MHADIRLSYSAVSSYERCPLSYRFQYLDKIEVEPTPYLSFGRSLHSALEWLYGRDVPVLPSLEELLQQLERCWEGDGYASPEEEASFMLRGKEVLSEFYRTNAEDFRPPVAVEHRFELDMDGYVLSGVIDRVDRHAGGGYEIIDYKTNRRLPDLGRLRQDLQLPIYQLACSETWGVSVSKLTFYYLMPNQRYTTKPYDREGLDMVKKRLDDVARLIGDGEFPARVNRLCPWCSFEDICPARTAGDGRSESYLSRHRSLLQRKRKLDKVIADLEEEMIREGISVDELEGYPD